MPTAKRRVVLYEYTCSGGLLDRSKTGRGSAIHAEGWSMLRALAIDFAAIGGTHVQVVADDRGLPGPLPDCELIGVCRTENASELLGRLSAKADWTVVIAPEFDGILYRLCQVVVDAPGRLLGTSSWLVEMLGDKQRTVGHLEEHGVPTPRGMLWSPGDSLPSLPPPVVVKPNDGAGSQDTYLCGNTGQFSRVLQNYRRAARVEAFVEGTPASVAFLCGPAGAIALPACLQAIRTTDKLEYTGGSLPVVPALATRAKLLATRAIRSLPKTCGYVGVDLVLGDDADGSGDCVMEINPRLTTSYVGLRALARTNLPRAMLEIAEGGRPHLSFTDNVVDSTRGERGSECRFSSPAQCLEEPA